MDHDFLTKNRLLRPLSDIFLPYTAIFRFLGFIIAVIFMLQMLEAYTRTGLLFSIHEKGQNSRQDNIDQKCKQLHWARDSNVTDRQYFWRLLVDDNHRLLYCVIPKVACTSFKTYIVKSSGKLRSGRAKVHSIRYLNSLGIGYLSQPMTGNVKYKLANYYTFIVVRHPFDRLISAYTDKFLNGSQFPRFYAKRIKNTFGDNIVYDDSGIIRISLSQFLILISRYYNNGFTDRHWQSYYDLCHPCDIRYDMIIKLETLDQDLPLFLKHIDEKSGSSLEIPSLNTARDGDNKLAEVSRIFSEVDPVIVNSLLNIYHKDFTLFGYTWSAEKGAGYL